MQTHSAVTAIPNCNSPWILYYLPKQAIELNENYMMKSATGLFDIVIAIAQFSCCAHVAFELHYPGVTSAVSAVCLFTDDCAIYQKMNSIKDQEQF